MLAEMPPGKRLIIRITMCSFSRFIYIPLAPFKIATPLFIVMLKKIYLNLHGLMFYFYWYFGTISWRFSRPDTWQSLWPGIPGNWNLFYFHDTRGATSVLFKDSQNNWHFIMRFRFSRMIARILRRKTPTACHSANDKYRN